jgi:hypothetical protein
MSGSGSIPPLEDLIGTRFVMLDSIRDSAFLGQGSGNDYGLGITDNPLFFFTSYYVPGNPTQPRLYPIKLFWIGSPAGTNDKTDTFNIYVADVVPENFYPGAPPNTGGPSSSWLVNPRLVLSATQAKSDIINWFDANYPGGASGGVGNGNSGSNTTYGTLAGGNSAVGNVSGMDSLDGQFWPIYDYVDNSVLLYFSIKTPNCNTLSIYCYKTTDTEFTSPLGSSQFLGGLYAPGWTTVFPRFTQNAYLLSSHRFSILSPDPLTVIPRAAGTQNAVFLYSYGVIDGSTPDHGRVVAGSIVYDIHTNPLSPGISLTRGTTGTPIVSSQVGEHFYTPDKLGSIVAANSVDSSTPGYVCVYNSPLEIDRRHTSSIPPGTIILSEMALRLLYYNPASGVSFGADALRVTQTPQVLGTCRAQFTDLPDGKTKLIYANFSWDQYLNLGYEYFEPEALSPRRQSKIRLAATGAITSVPSITCYTYSKKRMQVRIITRANSSNLSSIVNAIQITGAALDDPNNGFAFGYNPFVGSKYVHQEGLFSAGAPPITEFNIENLDPYVTISAVGPGKTPFIYVDLVD